MLPFCSLDEGAQHAAHDRGHLRLGRVAARRSTSREDLVLELSPPESRHYGSWNERLAHVARFSRPDESTRSARRRTRVGARAVMAVLDRPDPRGARSRSSAGADVALWAVVPNMYAFIRDLTDLGMVGAARARFMRLRPRR